MKKLVTNTLLTDVLLVIKLFRMGFEEHVRGGFARLRRISSNITSDKLYKYR